MVTFAPTVELEAEFEEELTRVELLDELVTDVGGELDVLSVLDVAEVVVVFVSTSAA
jgi:hypothetical protein